MNLGITSVVEAGMKLIDKLIPDPQAKQEHKLKLLDLAAKGELEQVRVALSAIMAEAASQDPWTSRARPSFLYVVYIYLLSAIPIGFASIFVPAATAGMAVGMKAWLAAIPEEMWWLFGAGYLGYTGFRSLDKRNGAKSGH